MMRARLSIRLPMCSLTGSPVRWLAAPSRAEVLEAVGVLLAFVAFGLAWAGLEGGLDPRPARAGPPWDAARHSPYPLRPMGTPDADPAIGLWLVDGFNVLHAGVLGGRDRSQWWTEPRRAELITLVERFEDPKVEIRVVFDGPRPVDGVRPLEPGPAGSASRVLPVFAPSADEWLVAAVRADPAPERITVVTADRKLAGRVRHRGAAIVSPWSFLARCRGGCDRPDPGRPPQQPL